MCRVQEKDSKICIIITSAFGLHHLYRGEFLYLKKNGFNPVVLAGPGDDHDWLRAQGIKTKVVPLVRQPCLFKDIKALFFLWWFLITNRFDIVHVSTPKAGLLGSLAARLSGHRRIFYTQRGRAYENIKGMRRKFYEVLEKLACSCSTRVIPICKELGDSLVKSGACKPHKIKIIGSGSSHGIDIGEFTNSDAVNNSALSIRKSLLIGERDIILLSIGRLRHDKGIDETVEAFENLSRSYSNLHLLLVGTIEKESPIGENTRVSIEDHPKIHWIRWTKETAPIYAASNILLFPSHREGFGNVALEAAAMGIPVIASDIMGCRESVANGLTGILVPKNNSNALEQAARLLIEDTDLRRKMGENGRDRVLREFTQERVWKGLIAEYMEALKRL